MFKRFSVFVFIFVVLFLSGFAWGLSCPEDLLPGDVDGSLVMKENLIPPNRYYFNVNAAELNQVLLNLGTNSIHAIEEKEEVNSTDFIRIFTTQPEEEEKRDTHIMINFQDSGKGIEEANLQKIYMPFFTTKAGLGKNKVQGRGLGLSMVYNIITSKFKGSIEVESVVDQGTTFHITLPLHINRE